MPRRSCSTCPFRKDGLRGLRLDRVWQIIENLYADKPFTCHKTRKNVCIGSLNFLLLDLEEEEAYDLQHVRTAIRLGIFSPTLEPPERFYASEAEMNKGHTFP